jgi:hypothetical protein
MIFSLIPHFWRKFFMISVEKYAFFHRKPKMLFVFFQFMIFLILVQGFLGPGPIDILIFCFCLKERVEMQITTESFFN